MADVLNGRSPRPVADQSTAELVQRASEQLSKLVRDEIALAKAELAEKGKHAGIGVGLFGAAGVLAVLADAVHEGIRLTDRRLLVAAVGADDRATAAVFGLAARGAELGAGAGNTLVAILTGVAVDAGHVFGWPRRVAGAQSVSGTSYEGESQESERGGRTHV